MSAMAFATRTPFWNRCAGFLCPYVNAIKAFEHH